VAELGVEQAAAQWAEDHGQRLQVPVTSNPRPRLRLDAFTFAIGMTAIQRCMAGKTLREIGERGYSRWSFIAFL